MAIYLSNLRYLVSDMREKEIDLNEFEVQYQRYKFRCILDIGTSPYELLIGAIDTNWAAVIYLKKGYEAEMTDKDFYKLCDLLELKPGGGVFTSYMFLKYISNHAPHKCKRRIVDPMYLFVIANIRLKIVMNHGKYILKAGIITCWIKKRQGILIRLKSC